MNPEEYKIKLKKLEEEFEYSTKGLRKQYAFSNNPYKIGDIITDNIGTIKIEKISFGSSVNSSFPECVYFGLELTKKLIPKKNEQKRWIYQSYIQEKPIETKK
jgi:hypothetical protein